MSTGSATPEASPPPASWPPSPGRSPQVSACEPYREWIEEAVRHGRLARSIWQDLVDDHGFRAGYASVRRFVAKLRAEATPREAHPRIETPPGQEAQVDYGDDGKTLDGFDFAFNPKIDRALVFELATGRFVTRAEDALFVGPPGSGKSHLAQAIGLAVIHHGHRVAYREVHALLEELADATLDGTRKDYLSEMATVPLLILDDLGMRKLPATAAEDLLELIMRRYERTSTIITSNRPVDDWGRLLGDTAAVTAMLDRLLHHGHLLKCGPKSWRTRTATALQREAATR